MPPWKWFGALLIDETLELLHVSALSKEQAGWVADGLETLTAVIAIAPEDDQKELTLRALVNRIEAFSFMTKLLFIQGGYVPSILFVVISVAVTVLDSGIAFGQDYPNKPVRIVTSLPGGGNDLKARLIAQGISGPLGQPVLIDNRGALVSIETVMKAPPDGYTLLVQGGTVWIYPLLAQTSFDAVRDFSPITLITGDASLVVVHPSLPVKSIKELIALAKAKPGALNYASGAAASSAHLQTELFNSMAGVNIVRIPYKGTGPALTGLVSGEVQVMIEGIAQLKPLVKSGKVRALAVTTAAPSAQLPELPTVSASGLPGFEAIQLNGMWAPARTPEAIIRRLNQEVVRVLNQPDIKEKLFNAGSEPGGGSPEELAAKIQADIKRWSKVIKEANIKVD